MARPGRSVICLNTAKIYHSIKEAAKDLDLDPAAVQRAAAGVRDRAGSYFFEYLDNLREVPADFQAFCEAELKQRRFWIEFGKELDETCGLL